MSIEYICITGGTGTMGQELTKLYLSNPLIKEVCIEISGFFNRTFDLGIIDEGLFDVSPCGKKLPVVLAARYIFLIDFASRPVELPLLFSEGFVPKFRGESPLRHGSGLLCFPGLPALLERGRLPIGAGGV